MGIGKDNFPLNFVLYINHTHLHQAFLSNLLVKFLIFIINILLLPL